MDWLPTTNCGFFSLRTGSTLVAVLEIFLALLGVWSTWAYQDYDLRRYRNRWTAEDRAFHHAIKNCQFYVEYLRSIIMIFACTKILWTAYEENKLEGLKLAVFFHILLLILDTLVWAAFAIVESHSWDTVELTVALVTSIIVASLRMYFIFVLNSYYKELEEGSLKLR